MTCLPGLVTGEDARLYTRNLNCNAKFNRPLQVGDRLEFELSQLLETPYVNRSIAEYLRSAAWSCHKEIPDHGCQRR